MSKIQLKRGDCFVMNGTVISHKFTIEAKHNGKWFPMADESGPMRYDTAEARDKKLDELKSRVKKGGAG